MSKQLVAVAALAVGMAPDLAAAGGLFIPETGTQAMERAGAFAAKADDPSALAINPAGLAKLSGTVIEVGFNLVNLSLSYQREGVYEPTGDADLPYEGQPYPEVTDESKPSLGFGGYQAIPLLVVVSDLGLETPLRVAAGLVAPNAYPSREFMPGYTFEDPVVGPPPQRYDVMRQEALVAKPTIGAAYRVMPELDVGVSATWGIGSLKATSNTWGVRNYEEWIGKDGQFSIDVKDNFVPGFGAGLLYRPHPSVELGLAYESGYTLDGKGTGVAALGIGLGVGGERDFIAPVDDADAQCAPGGKVGALKACLTVNLPQTATVGARWILRDSDGEERVDVEADLRWEDWSAASDYRVTVDGKSSITGFFLNPQDIKHGAVDTWSMRLGGSYTMPIGANRLNLRGGVAYDTEAVPASWTRVDFDGKPRTTVGAGVALQLKKVRIDVGGGVSVEPDRTVTTCNPDSDDLGCTTPGVETPIKDRVSPDPVQPLLEDNQQVESPYNGGTYQSGFTILTVGVTTWF